MTDDKLDEILTAGAMPAALAQEVAELRRIAELLDCRVSGMTAIRLPEDNPLSAVLLGRINKLRDASEALQEMAKDIEISMRDPDVLGQLAGMMTDDNYVDRDHLKCVLDTNKGQA